jgi:hypothetical protein
MDTLYRKVKTEKGATRYEPVHEWDYGGRPEPGVYVVSKDRHGWGYRWVNEYVGPAEGIPKNILRRAGIERIRDKTVARLVESRSDGSVDSVISAVIDVLSEEVA